MKNPLINKTNPTVFHGLKLIQKKELTKNTFLLDFEIPYELKNNYTFQSGQYITLKYSRENKDYFADYSITAEPFEEKITIGIKINHENSPAAFLYKDCKIGDVIEISEPKGRFTLIEKPHEFRTIIGFCMGIGITPIFSHFKHILRTEPRTRLFLFYGNKTVEDTVFKTELDQLVQLYPERLEVHYFYSQEKVQHFLYQGRLNAQKLVLIINQILHLDDTDEESTIWDAVDEVLICGKGDMIKNLANACYNHGIPKKNIHFELFQTYEEDIYPPEKEIPIIENVEINFSLYNNNYTTTLPDNKNKILNYLLDQEFPIPYSCKSGICGSCQCKLLEGVVELLENEYLTEAEQQEGNILACMAIPMSKKIMLKFE